MAVNYFVKLSKGSTYTVFENKFFVGKEQEVDKETFDYLKNNEQFTVRESESTEPTPEAYTKASLKKLNKEQQEEIIAKFGTDPEVAKNEDERIALILELQDKGE